VCFPQKALLTPFLLSLSLPPSRSIISQRSLRDRRRASSAASGSISGRSIRQSHDRLQAITENEFNNVSPSHSIKNSVQAQIEKMFTEVANDDSTLGSRFSIRYLGSLPLTSRVTSLVGLQDPLRQLYLGNAGHEVSYTIHTHHTPVPFSIKRDNRSQPVSRISPIHLRTLYRERAPN
jgi:hypothetical protein